MGISNGAPSKKGLTPSRFRWAMLAVTLVMGVALVAAALTSFVSAHQASKVVSEAVGAELLRAASLEIWASGEEDELSLSQALAAVLEDHSEDGLRYLGAYSRDGSPLAEAGERDTSALVFPGPRSIPPRPTRASAKPVGPHGRLRIVAPARRGRGGPSRMPGRMGRFGGGRSGHLLVLEYLPVKAREITLRAGRSLLVSLLGAAILLLATAVAWRFSLRAARGEAQLARDRQLKALGQMSAVLGHEVRNPLASLKGHAQVLLEQLPSDDPRREGAQTVVDEAKRLEDLTGQVLDFARTGEITGAPVVVMEMVRAATERSEAAPVTIESENQIPDWPLDRSRMEQVLENLLINARQNSPANQPVELSVQVSQGELQIEVRDRGQGIEPGDEERIFEPFFTKRVRGTGLGLALARRIVEGHGGQITAANHPDSGAIFRITLPG